MPIVSPWVLAAALLAQSSPLQWMSFEIVNPRASGGHRILHLKDVLQPDPQAPIPGLPKARAVVIASVAPAQCGLEAGEDRCAALAALSSWAKKRQGLVIGLILNDEQEAPALKARLQRSRLPFPVAVDTYQVWRSMLKMQAPGSFLIVAPPDLAEASARPPRRLAAQASDGAEAQSRLEARVKRALSQALEAAL